MARSKIKRSQRKKTDRLPVVSVLGIATGLLIAYTAAETAMDPSAHPLHWLVAFAGGVVGYLVGLLWYWRRGDVV